MLQLQLGNHTALIFMYSITFYMLVAGVTAFPMTSGSLHAGVILPREETCGGQPGATHCGFDLPSNFCCAANTQCLALNDTATPAAICCPAGQTCTTIQPITCNTIQQDASRYPALPFHMVDTSIALPRCGLNCCPLGYVCEGDSNCRMLESTKTTSSATISAVSTTMQTSGTALLSTSTTTASTSLPSSSTSSTSVPASLSPNATSASATGAISPSTNDSVTGKGFAAGFIPGIVVGMLLMFAILFFLFRRGTQSKRGSMDSFGEHRPNFQISDPIYQPQMAARTDFVHHQRNASGSSQIQIRQVPASSDSPATVISAPLGAGSIGGSSPFTGYYGQQSSRPGTGSDTTLTDEIIPSRPNGNISTPTPAPRRKLLSNHHGRSEAPGLSLSLDDYGPGSPKAMRRKGPSLGGRQSPLLRRKPGSSTLFNTKHRSSSRSSRHSSSGETIEISMGPTLQPATYEAGSQSTSRPRHSSYYPPQAHEPDFMGSGPKTALPDDDSDDSEDLRRQTTYSDVLRIMGANESKISTPDSPVPEVPALPRVIDVSGSVAKVPRLGSPWKPLRTLKK